MVVLAAGSLLLLASLGAAFTLQGRINAYLTEPDHSPNTGPAGALPLWLLLAGLALSAASLLA